MAERPLDTTAPPQAHAAPQPPVQAADVELHRGQPVIVVPTAEPSLQPYVSQVIAHRVSPRPQSDRVNPAAVVALITAFVFPPAGFALARMARRECREDGRRGQGMALAASLISALGSGALVLVTLLLLSGLVSGLSQLASALGTIATVLGIIGRLLPG